MKALALLLSAVAVSANAETINLSGPLGSSSTNQVQTYSNIPNDAGLTVDYQDWYGQGRLTLTDGAGNVIACSSTSSATNLTCLDGSWALVSIVQTQTRTCVRSGRGQTCTTHWTLQSGTVERP